MWRRQLLCAAGATAFGIGGVDRAAADEVWSNRETYSPTGSTGKRLALARHSNPFEFRGVELSITVPEKPAPTSDQHDPTLIYFPGIYDCMTCLFDTAYLLQPVLQWNMYFDGVPELQYPGEWVATPEYVRRGWIGGTRGWVAEPLRVDPGARLTFAIRRMQEGYWRVAVTNEDTGEEAWLATDGPENQTDWAGNNVMKHVELALEAYMPADRCTNVAPTVTFEDVTFLGHTRPSWTAEKPASDVAEQCGAFVNLLDVDEVQVGGQWV